MKLERPISETRIARLTRWAALWLTHLLGFLASNGGKIPTWAEKPLRHALDIVAGFVARLISYRAVRQIHVARATPRGPIKKRGAVKRAVIGADLRRRFRGGDIQQRAEALLRALCNLDRLIERQARRLAHGLCRRRGGVRPQTFIERLRDEALRACMHADSS